MRADIAPFALAQPVVARGDIAANVARLVLFPELALTLAAREGGC